MLTTMERISRGNKPKNTTFVEDKKRKEKWAHFTEGYATPKRLFLEGMYENQEKFIANLINEGVSSADLAIYTKFAFPLITRAFADIALDELISIQNMPDASGYLTSMEWKYENSIYPTVAEDRIDTENFGVDGKLNPYYGSGAKGEIPTGAVNSSNKVFTTLHYPVSHLKVYVDGVEATLDSYTYPDKITNGQFTIHAAPTTGSVVTVDYNVNPEGEDITSTLTFEFVNYLVECISHKLKSEWPLEAQLKMKSSRGMDIEKEVLKVLGEQIKREIQFKVLADLYNNVGTNVNWMMEYDPSAGMPGEGYTKDKYLETIYHAINSAAGAIDKKMMVDANWAVVHTDIATRLENLEGFTLSADGKNVSKGLKFFGILKNKYRIYKAPNVTENKILVGHKGNSELEAGYILGYFVPFLFGDRREVKDFVYSRAIASMYAQQLVNKNYFATVTLI